MSKRPNNFPREGEHNIVTRAAVKRLEAERPTPNLGIHHTIGGDVETLVHSTANAEREAAITSGMRRLEQSSADLRAAYVREQKALRAHWHARGPGRTR